ncbi:hypothetical protein HWV62_1889 [Athelia sp. TMB]|nr:hypothetical protein HWV62_1889 [Athelia sp. TMB]
MACIQTMPWSSESPSSAEATTAGRIMTRRKFAHITVIEETGVPSTNASILEQVDFRIILEPLVLGVLPASLQPTLFAIVVFGVLASLAVPYMNRYLEKLASISREEIDKLKVE